MKWIVSKYVNLGDYLMSLSDQARLTLVVLALLLLGGGGVWKLVASIYDLQKPLPAASAEQLIKPMEGLFTHTQKSISHFQYTERLNAVKLDSLMKIRPTKTALP